jgi:hypothetical protein
MNPPRPSRFRIVPQGQVGSPRLQLLWWLLPLWLASLVLVGWLLSGSGGDAGSRLHKAERELAQANAQVEQLTRAQATAQASDRISRAALTDVQTSLAEREEEIAGLRADVAFYERLVGSTSQRKGLNAHSVEFSPEQAGSWHYTVVLTQNLNRGAISQGQMRFSVEGVQGGKLTTVSWDELHQRRGVPAQAYSFRYFQQIDGSVMLPADFTPQRVRVTLSGSGGTTSQSFDWKLAGGARGE